MLDMPTIQKVLDFEFGRAEDVTSGTTLLSVAEVGLSSHYNQVSPVVLLGGVPHVSKDFRDCSLSHAAQLKRWSRRDEVSTRTESIRTHTFRLGHINLNIQMSAFSN